MKRGCILLAVVVISVLIIKVVFLTWLVIYKPIRESLAKDEFGIGLDSLFQGWGQGNETEKRNVLSDIRNYFSLKANNETVKFFLYKDRRNTSVFEEINPDDPVSLSVLRDGDVLKILIHGFAKAFNNTFPRGMKNAFLEKSNHSVLIVDWSIMAGARHIALPKPIRKAAEFLLYDHIVENNVPQVGRYVGGVLAKLQKDQVISSVTQLHVLGHSLGAHLAGHAGLAVQTELDEKVGRITGLDPAGPLFTNKPLEHRLDKWDAAFVDIIHTSHYISDRRATGHVDFYPNSAATTQPGCENSNRTSIEAAWYQIKTFIGYCDHSRAIDYYIKSITDGSMLGCKFAHEDPEERYRQCSDHCEESVVFGEAIGKEVRGEYCLAIEL